MTDLLKQTIHAQFDAALHMLDDCIRLCPAEHWDDKVAKYAFWHVAYHTLCCADVYLSKNEEAFKPGPMHPRGISEIDDEYPSRSFSKEELTAYAQHCHEKLTRELAAETPESLAGPSGHPRRTFPRAELYLYNMRHVMHHTGQLAAVLRRAGVDTSWVSRNWR
jgi:uncharacterized damage-inducible protein DinB